ncbi:MFS transporter [Duganella sp. FT92W]|uniref:MFS transporter n=1 Tax=Pseudoduganella rivuli TaxID=2666085 RepID=A0A7X2IV43_9BURK|nr:MFS transporter [Pseudoduganella rivuli]MRV76505.1 MFS transporter [Pseudoduganella rivuli]
MHVTSSRSTRLAFFANGIAMSAWAPLVPYAKTRLQLEPAHLGMILLCLGIGSMLAMPATGALTARFGCRKVMTASGSLVCAILPMLALASSPLQLALALFLFGASIGTMDVAMNVQAVEVEKHRGIPLMSGFHGMYSVGGFAGAAGVTLLLANGVTPAAACIAVAMLAASLLLAARSGMLAATGGNGHALFVMPRGRVIVIGLLCFAVFMAEGAVLDWSALLLAGMPGFATSEAGLGYAAFAIAMTTGRFGGDRIVRRWGNVRVLLCGGICAAAGFFTAVLAPHAAVVLAGFALVGLGASNIVPILFTAAGRQPDMPASLAVGAITAIGYTGILTGPALIGFIAHAASLQLAFAGLGCAMLVVAAGARIRAVAGPA